MKKILFTIFLLLPIKSFANDIVVTIKPIYSLVKAIGGDKVDLYLLIDGVKTPHSFILKPSHLKKIHNAHAIFYIDSHFEEFLPKVLKSAPEHLRKISLAHNEDIKLLKVRKDDNWETPQTSQEHAGHDHGDLDLHIWLSHKNAIILSKIIVRELSYLYPEHKSYFKKNAKDLIAKIKVNKAQIAKILAPYSKSPYLVFHDAYQYFENEFNLNSVGSIMLNPKTYPSIKRVREVRNKIKQTNSTCVFLEPQFDRKIIDIISPANIKLGVIDPLGVDVKMNENFYFNLMHNLAKNIATCLK
jgi:zinc transport system substrate-binding protein